jgi:hypothetical protein
VKALEDMLLVTDIYYRYLSDERVGDEEEWKTCFEIYSQLFRCLNDMEKKSKIYWTAAEEDKKQVIKNAIKLKKGELKSLETIFAKL